MRCVSTSGLLPRTVSHQLEQLVPTGESSSSTATRRRYLFNLGKWLEEKERKSQGSQGHKKNVHYLCMGGDTEDDSTADLQQKVLASDELDEYEEGEGGECLDGDS